MLLAVQVDSLSFRKEIKYSEFYSLQKKKLGTKGGIELSTVKHTVVMY
jgi:hypothetical protein